MFPYSKHADDKYFNGYGVKLEAHSSARNSYCNSILQLLINIDRKFAHELFAEIFYYEGDDSTLKELKTVLDHIRKILEANKDRMENLRESDVSLGRTPPAMRKETIIDGENPVDTPVDTANLVKWCETEFKDSLDPKNRSGNQSFFEIILMKYHQMFKRELECSFMQFSCDTTCSCPIHTTFGMKYIDTQASHNTEYLSGNRFSIPINVANILKELKKNALTKREKLSDLEGNLFKFYQNQRWGKPIINEVSEFCLQLQGADNSTYLTFKVETNRKDVKNYNRNLAFFLAMMPQFLNGEEFKHIDIGEEEMVSSPTGQLCAIVANHKDRFATIVDIETNWTYFSDKCVRNLNFYENVIENLLKEGLCPFILIYKVGPVPVQRHNKQVMEIIDDYLLLTESKKHKEEKKVRATLGDEEQKEEIDPENDTSSDNHDNTRDKIAATYQRRSVARSLISNEKQNGKKGKKTKLKSNFC